MKKIFGVIVAAAAVLGSVFALSACSDGGHTEHDYTGAWVTTDPEYHWHVCTADGCGETDEKQPHVWVADESKTDVPATCIADGIHYLKCACGATKSEAITTRPNHDYTGEWVNTDSEYHWHVCTTDGCGETDERQPHVCNQYEKVDDNVHSKSCECGYSVNEAHTWDGGVVTKEPSETEKGIRTYTCGVCHGTKTEVIPETSHEHTPNAGWSNDGNSHWHTCSGCSEQLDKADHSWNGGEVTTQPTCTTKGIKTYTCTVCNKTKTEEIEKNSHNFTGEWVNTDADYHWHVCTNEGCGEIDEKVAHNWVADESKTDDPATCNMDGTHYVKCSVCGREKSEPITDRPAHDYTEQPYVSDGADGHHRVCKACGESSATVAHSLVDGVTVTEPTFWTAGSKTVTCEHCDYTGTATIERIDTADFAKDFLMEANPNGSWSYGQTVYNFDNETFTFTAATDKNEGGDGWVIGGCEIKDGFINSDNWATVAFTFTEDTAATVNFKFTGNHVVVKDPNTGEEIEGEENKFNCRIGVKNSDGNLYSVPTFIGGDGGWHVCSNLDENGKGGQYNFKAGDTIYFMIEHTGGWASGTLELTITRNAANA